ncbi:sensor histidine kinase [Kibdelosporangium phytohabitans]|uniref:Anti-sigma regulatory factor n=1 Tax=Kibdelosporangium phytohabitans TaxID=860235 RepID=A0A0N7F4E4_9PSEU|nr:sensor histidine kinase [Kibdelosporangium phytohabitans]ALG11199.1 anti-sigma regulatory factor [Kibdelosporangium phytohabitans]MBE1462463.1 anti-sigma regulatory factor (Ser/Thr protein kinase) [Kibdelosporangium phytohabitans]
MTADPFVHPALFYRGADEYVTATVPFIAEGLAKGEPVAAVVPGPRLELIRTALGADAARVHLADMTEVGRNPGRIIPGVLRAFADSHRGRVRIVGEPVWADRSVVEYPACAQHEALINRAFAGRKATILCPYDTESLSPTVLADALRTHPAVIDTDGQHTSTTFAPDAVVAAYNQPLFAPANAECRMAGASSLAELRQFVAKFASQSGLSDTRASDLVLAVDELAANSARHGGGTGTVYLWDEPGELVCQISDAGYLRDPLLGRIPAPVTQVGGRGLLLVNHLADLVRTHTTPAGTTIRVHFRH